MRAILLNGPPRSGKDSAATALFQNVSSLENWYFFHEKMSFPNKAAFAGMMHVSFDEEDFNVDYYEDHKEEIVFELDISFRQFQIDFSESFMKPKYGIDIFGRLLLGRIFRNCNKDNEADVFVISDCGFQAEVNTLIKSGVFRDVLLIRCHRPGFDFSSDSRSYVSANGYNIAQLDATNDGSLSDWQGKIVEATTEWLNQVVPPRR